MEKIIQEELDIEVSLHRKWLRGEDGGKRLDLSGRNLTGANLTGANLTRADLTGADLTRADLTDVKNMWCPMACPDTGSFIAWKKAALNDGSYAIIKLRILADSKRSSSTGRKCRTDKADVLEIQSLHDGTLKNYASSKYDASFCYIPGTTVSVPDFEENRWKECAPGIHFFINRQEAVDYVL